MRLHTFIRTSASVTVAVAGAVLAWASPTDARITRIIIDRTASLTATGQTIAYETVAGRAGSCPPSRSALWIAGPADHRPGAAIGARSR